MNVNCFIFSFSFIMYLIVSEMLSNSNCGQSNAYSKLFLNYESHSQTPPQKEKENHQIWK